MRRSLSADDVLSLKRAAAGAAAGLDRFFWSLHSRPELSGSESETSRAIAGRLRTISGIDAISSFGGHGVVGILRNGPGPVVMIRGDMDGLPIAEETGHPFASRHEALGADGLPTRTMHACGHDVHSTALVGTAETLAQYSHLWNGTALFVGQPGEETGTGARAMLDAGLYTRFPRPDLCLACHVQPTYPTGSIGVATSVLMAASDKINVTAAGPGGHAGLSEGILNPITVGAELWLLFGEAAKRLAEGQRVILQVGEAHGGRVRNTIPTEYKMQLTLRTLSEDVRERIIAGLESAICEVVARRSIPEVYVPRLEILDTRTPPVINDTATVSRLTEVWKSALGDQNVHIAEPRMSGEDFAWFSHRQPGIRSVMFWVGSSPPGTEHTAADLHSPKFAAAYPETAATAIEALSLAAIHEFNRQA